MDNLEDNPLVKQAFRVNKIIAMAMVASLGVYALIVEVLRGQQESFPGCAPESAQHLPDIFMIVALIIIVVITKARKTLLKISPADEIETKIRKLTTATVVTFALSEVPVLLGLILFLLGGYVKEFYMLLTLSALMMGLHFPKADHWAVWFRKS